MKIKQTLAIALLASATSFIPALSAQEGEVPAETSTSTLQASVDALIAAALANPDLDLTDPASVQAAIQSVMTAAYAASGCTDSRRPRKPSPHP